MKKKVSEIWNGCDYSKVFLGSRKNHVQLIDTEVTKIIQL